MLYLIFSDLWTDIILYEVPIGCNDIIACNLSNSKCVLESFFATDVINSLQANIILIPQIDYNEIQPSSRPPPERVKYLHEENCKKNQQSTNCKQHCTLTMKSSHKYTLTIKTVRWTFS